MRKMERHIYHDKEIVAAFKRSQIRRLDQEETPTPMDRRWAIAALFM